MYECRAHDIFANTECNFYVIIMLAQGAPKSQEWKCLWFKAKLSPHTIRMHLYVISICTPCTIFDSMIHKRQIRTPYPATHIFCIQNWQTKSEQSEQSQREISKLEGNTNEIRKNGEEGRHLNETVWNVHIVLVDVIRIFTVNYLKHIFIHFIFPIFDFIICM